jgi:release factor glutamine methyltransferase
MLRLQAHEPLQYVVGETAFRELDLLCDERALVPRFETEQLIDLIPARDWKQLIDVGTGTGCIALAAATRFPNAQITAIDRSTDALTLARSNAAKNRISHVQWQEGFLLDGVAPNSADLILANLPYISTDEMHVLPADVLRYEPHLALHSGDTGMELIEQLIVQAMLVLQSAGLLLLEIGEKQGESLAEFARNQGMKDVSVHQDLAGKPRFLMGSKHG